MCSPQEFRRNPPSARHPGQRKWHATHPACAQGHPLQPRPENQKRKSPGLLRLRRRSGGQLRCQCWGPVSPAMPSATRSPAARPSCGCPQNRFPQDWIPACQDRWAGCRSREIAVGPRYRFPVAFRSGRRCSIPRTAPDFQRRCPPPRSCSGCDLDQKHLRISERSG